MERRTLVRLLVGLGIGIPVAIEGATLLGMLDRQFADGSETTRTTTREDDRTVGVGDDLLPSTPQTERVTRSLVEAGDDWTFTFEVAVANGGDAPYDLRLGPVTLGDGREVAGTVSSGSVRPGGSTTLEAAWTVPAGSLPTAVLAVATVDPGGDRRVVTEQVSLAKVPVRRA